MRSDAEATLCGELGVVSSHVLRTSESLKLEMRKEKSNEYKELML